MKTKVVHINVMLPNHCFVTRKQQKNRLRVLKSGWSKKLRFSDRHRELLTEFCKFSTQVTYACLQFGFCLKLRFLAAKFGTF